MSGRDLYAQLRLRGRANKWARRLGIPYAPRVPRFTCWDHDRIRAAIAPFLEQHERWPSAAEFFDAGLRAPRLALAEQGGAKRWAAEFGLEFKPFANKSGEIWTDVRLERELRRFVSGFDHWPTRVEFRAARRYDLWVAATRLRGHERWARQFSLPRRRRSAGEIRT